MNIEEKKLMINEETFVLEIFEWDDFTLGLFKQYSDWKCNNQNDGIEPLQEMQEHFQNNTDIDRQDQDGASEKRILGFSGIPMFPEDQVLARTSDYGNAPIYKPILDFILDEITDSFTKREVFDAVQSAYKKHGRGIKDSTAVLYGGSYCKYMIANKIAFQGSDGVFHKEQVEESDNGITNGETNDDLPKVKLDLPKKKTLLEDWLIRKNQLYFTVDEFLEVYPKQRDNKNHLYENIAKLVRGNKIIQMEGGKFRINI